MACKVTIDDVDYFIPCEHVQDLELINNNLVNISSSDFILKSSFSFSGNDFPYIICDSNSLCRLYSSSHDQFTAVTTSPVFSGDVLLTVNYPYLITCLLFILIGVRLVWKK